MGRSRATLQDYRGLDLSALDARITEARRKLQEMRAELAIRKLTNHAAIRHTRQELARLLTVRQEKTLLASIADHE